MKQKFTLATLPVILTMVGCTSMAPEYERTQNAIPKEFHSTGIYSNNATAPQNTPEELKWENYIQHQNLKKVVEQSLSNNKDLKIALANIQAAKAQYGISKADTLPTINAGANASRAGTQAGITDNFQATVGMTAFELDFFGRVSSLNSAALSSFLATQEAQKVTELTILSETIKAYFNVSLAKSQLDIAKSTEQTTKGSMELIRKRVEHGVSTAKDLSDIESIYYLAQADIFNYQTQLEKSINALNALVGSQVDKELLPSNIQELKGAIKKLDVALSSEILYNRPDVLAAEYQLKATNANIGAAKAAFFPRISLTTSIGTASSDLSNLFSDSFKVWNFIPSITIPIFDNARNTSNLQLTEAQRDKALATYEKSIQTAFKEVSDVLARKGTIEQQITAYNKHIDSTKTSFDLATKLYEAGAKDYLSVLTAQNSLYSAQKNALNLYKEAFDNSVDVYKVIGNK